MNKTTTISRMDTPIEPFLRMTDAQVLAAAMADPDARPMTHDDFKSARRVPQIKIIRRALKLSQEEFATRYYIPIGTLRDWEQSRKEPDAAARAYLRVIAREPEAVRRALAPMPHANPQGYFWASAARFDICASGRDDRPGRLRR